MKCTCCGEETDVQYRLGDAAPAFQGMCRRCVLNWGEIDMACYDCGKWLSRTAYKLYGKYYCVQCFLKNTVITDETPSYAQTWISVKDRLPDKDGKYLVCGNIHLWDIEKYRNNERIVIARFTERKEWLTSLSVKFWKPLPEPPESEDAE